MCSAVAAHLGSVATHGVCEVLHHDVIVALREAVLGDDGLVRPVEVIQLPWCHGGVEHSQLVDEVADMCPQHNHVDALHMQHKARSV